MNANRDLIWGAALSLLLHGAFLRLPFSAGGQGPTPTHQFIPLEISLVKLKGHDDTRPTLKLVPLSRPPGVRQSLSMSRRKITTRREKSALDVGNKPIPVLSEKPISPLTEKTLTPTPMPLSFASQRQIEDTAPQPGGEMREKAPWASSSPLAGTPVKGGDFKASPIPEGGDSPKSRPMILARPRYDRNPKPPYPRIAQRRGYEGVVVLKVEILPNGRVGQLRVKRSSGHHILDRSALKTVKQWKFIPAKQGEDPIRIWAEIPIKFELE